MARIARLRGKNTEGFNLMRPTTAECHTNSTAPVFSTSTLQSACMPGRSPKGLHIPPHGHQPGQNHEYIYVHKQKLEEHLRSKEHFHRSHQLHTPNLHTERKMANPQPIPKETSK